MVLPVMVRYARKTKELYLGSETPEGKASKWTSHYEEGAWTNLTAESARSNMLQVAAQWSPCSPPQTVKPVRLRSPF